MIFQPFQAPCGELVPLVILSHILRRLFLFFRLKSGAYFFFLVTAPLILLNMVRFFYYERAHDNPVIKARATILLQATPTSRWEYSGGYYSTDWEGLI